MNSRVEEIRTGSPCTPFMTNSSDVPERHALMVYRSCSLPDKEAEERPNFEIISEAKILSSFIEDLIEEKVSFERELKEKAKSTIKKKTKTKICEERSFSYFGAQGSRRRNHFILPQYRKQLLYKKILRCLETMSSPKEISREAKVSLTLIRKISSLQQISPDYINNFFSFDYGPESVQRLFTSIIKNAGVFWSSQVLRVLARKEGCILSLPQTRKVLKSLGYRYLSNRRSFHRANQRTKVLLKTEAEKDQFLRVTSLLLHGALSRHYLTVFVDEMTLNLNQTPLFMWKKGQTIPITREDSPHERTQIVAIVACSSDEILGYQFFQTSVRASDFSFFMIQLDQSIATSHPECMISYLMDNSPVHTLYHLEQTSIPEKVIFNVVGLSSINLVELLFSKMRYLFRSRFKKQSYFEELKQLLELFTEGNKQKDFRGYSRQWLRNLNLILKMNFDF